MKKYIFFIATCFMFGTSVYAQKITYNKMYNGVNRLCTEPLKIKMEDDVLFALNIFFDKENYEFFIEIGTEKDKMYNFPEEAKLLFKTMDGSVIELKSCYTYITKGVDYRQIDYRIPGAYYPISEKQLQSLFTGVSKVRVELLSYNKKEKTIFKDFQDVEYKKDTFGKFLQKSYTKLMTEKSKIDKQNAALLNKDASADF
ncbi:MAG: hypothetical protein IJ693_03750 [Bacteroidaceae bacterium]|nr:hypothetical protein [Bacteroidaceae bacterium]